MGSCTTQSPSSLPSQPEAMIEPLIFIAKKLEPSNAILPTASDNGSYVSKVTQ
jgi:hypothetical protein